MKLLNRYTNEVIIERDVSTMKKLVEIAVIERISLRAANLIGANLCRADLYGANLSGANLRGADLSGSNLCSADLERADLRRANLSVANLYGANLSGSNLRGADLSRAKSCYSFVAYDTSKRLVHCIKHKDTWMIKAGCFWGTLEELEAKVKETHNSKVYLANIELLKTLD